MTSGCSGRAARRRGRGSSAGRGSRARGRRRRRRPLRGGRARRSRTRPCSPSPRRRRPPGATSRRWSPRRRRSPPPSPGSSGPSTSLPVPCPLASLRTRNPRRSARPRAPATARVAPTIGSAPIVRPPTAATSGRSARSVEHPRADQRRPLGRERHLPAVHVIVRRPAARQRERPRPQGVPLQAARSAAPDRSFPIAIPPPPLPTCSARHGSQTDRPATSSPGRRPARRPRIPGRSPSVMAGSRSGDRRRFDRGVHRGRSTGNSLRMRRPPPGCRCRRVQSVIGQNISQNIFDRPCPCEASGVSMKSFKPFNDRRIAPMTSSETLLKTRQVAGALGREREHDQAVGGLRGVAGDADGGQASADPASEAIRFAREQGLPHGRAPERWWAAGAGLGDGGRRRPSTGWRTALRAGRAGGGPGADPRGPMPGCGDASRLADDLIRPVMERVGHGWKVGSLDVYQEHQATPDRRGGADGPDRQGHARRAGRPGARWPSGRRRRATRTCSAGLLGELVLRELGWDVMQPRPEPAAGLAGQGRRGTTGPRLVFLSVEPPGGPGAVRPRIRRPSRSRPRRRARRSSSGGRALGPTLRARLVVASFGDRMAHLAEFARRLRPGGRARNRSRLADPTRTEPREDETP